MDVTDLVWIDSTGYNYEDYPAFLSWLTAQYQSIYGPDVYLGPDSQDGQFLAVVAQALYDTAALGAVTYNSFSPVTAQSVGLSRVVKINGITRLIPTNSTVALTIVGTTGTVLGTVGNPAIAIDDLEQQWVIPVGTTIPLSGTVTVTATAAQPGAINAQPDTVQGIFTPTQGWQSVNNVGAATPGDPVETDAALRARQIHSVALPAETVFDATLGAVANVPGVLEVVGYENPTSIIGPSVGYENVPPAQPAHSIAVVVEGGDSAAIAAAIQIYKTPGTQTWGTTSILVHDSKGMPLLINFYIATPATIGAQVTITTGQGWVTATGDLIKAAVAAALVRYSIGSDIIITQLYQSAYLYGTPEAGTFVVDSIELSYDGGPLGSANIQLAFNETPECNPSTDVTIVT